MEADRDRPPINYNNNHLQDFDGYAAPPSPPPPSSSKQWHGNKTPPSSSSSSSVYGGVGVGAGYIEHPVSKFDTLAGVAIKYGVEVADIKKMNGLVTDLQMFALKTLQIPLPGRHPPSPCLSNGSETPGQSNDHIPARRRHSDLFESFQSLRVNYSTKVSPAMSSLRGYYGLKDSENSITTPARSQMTNYRKGTSHYLEDGPFLKQSSAPNPLLSHHRKSRSLAVMAENDESSNGTAVGGLMEGESKKWVEKVIKKSEEGLGFCTPEKLLKDDSNNSGWFSSITGKGLALRSKAGSRTSLVTDMETSGSNADPVSAGDFVVDHASAGVRKSSSTSSLQEQENNSSSMWPPPMWGLKPDFSTSAITKPIFDSLPKPITGRRNKAALD